MQSTVAVSVLSETRPVICERPETCSGGEFQSQLEEQIGQASLPVSEVETVSTQASSWQADALPTSIDLIGSKESVITDSLILLLSGANVTHTDPFTDFSKQLSIQFLQKSPQSAAPMQPEVKPDFSGMSSVKPGELEDSGKATEALPDILSILETLQALLAQLVSQPSQLSPEKKVQISTLLNTLGKNIPPISKDPDPMLTEVHTMMARLGEMMSSSLSVGSAKSTPTSEKWVQKTDSLPQTPPNLLDAKSVGISPITMVPLPLPLPKPKGEASPLAEKGIKVASVETEEVLDKLISELKVKVTSLQERVSMTNKFVVPVGDLQANALADQTLQVTPVARKTEPSDESSGEVPVEITDIPQGESDALPLVAHRKSENSENQLSHPDLAQTAKPETVSAPKEDQKISHFQNMEKQEKQELVLSQFRSFMAVNKLKATTELTLKLHPKELGEIKINVTRIENNATHDPSMIVAKFQVSSEMVKSILESNFNFLKDSLSQQAQMVVSSLSVDVNTQSEDHSFEQHLAHQPKMSVSSDESFSLTGSSDSVVQETQQKHTVLSSLA